MEQIAGARGLWLMLIGTLVGIVSGCLGVGSGILLVPALVMTMGLAQRGAQAISLLVMVPMVMMAAIRYATHATIRIDWWPVALLAVGGVLGANVGSSIAFAVPADVLRRIFAVFIILLGLQMLRK